MLPFDSAEFSTGIWLFVYGVCVVAMIVTVCVSIFPGLRTRLVWGGLKLSLICVSLFAFADIMSRVVPNDSTLLPDQALHFLAACAGAVIAVAICSPPIWRARSFWWKRWGRVAAYLTAYSIAAAGLGVRFYQIADAPPEWTSPVDPSGDPKLANVDAYALTDTGRRIPLFHFDAAVTAESTLPEQFLGRVVVLKTAAKSLANCHGWVFTHGCFLVRSLYVDDILQDNGYQRIDSPQPGDLIIYRNPAGQPVHTGVVKAAGQEGFVLIESKWGPLDTYLHLPDDQSYSLNYDFYRSARSGHRLKVIEGNNEMSGINHGPGLVEQNQHSDKADPKV